MTAHLRVTVVVAMLAIVAGLAWFVGSGERAMFGADTAAQDAAPAEHAATAPSGPVAGASRGTQERAAPVSLDRLGRLLAGDRKPSDTQRQVARDFHALYGRWEDGRYEALFARPSPERAARIEERVEWFRQRLGECGEGAPLSVTDAENARFVYTCERGALEAGFTLDPESLRITGMAIGARGVEPEPAVLAAARNVVALIQAWDLATFEQTFGAKYQPEQVRKFLEEIRATRGTCRLGKPDLVSARGGLFLLPCEHAERLLKIELDDEDRIAVYRITAPPSQQ